jgi:hypothetical protein
MAREPKARRRCANAIGNDVKVKRDGHSERHRSAPIGWRAAVVMDQGTSRRLSL